MKSSRGSSFALRFPFFICGDMKSHLYEDFPFFSSVMTEKQTHQQTSRETQMMTIKNHSCLCSGKNLWLKFQWNFICNFMLFEISNKPILEVWKLCETLWNFVKFYHWNFNKFHWNFILFQIVWNFRTLSTDPLQGLFAKSPRGWGFFLC